MEERFKEKDLVRKIDEEREERGKKRKRVIKDKQTNTAVNMKRRATSRGLKRQT